ncbi:MAG: hypothetical protein ACK5NG_08280 [Chthoniobacterales bacterium]
MFVIFTRSRKSATNGSKTCLQVFFSLLLMTAMAVSAPAELSRVAVVFNASGRGGERQAILTAELSRRGVTLVERKRLAEILSEREIRGDFFSPLANVDVFLHFRQIDSKPWLIESIDAASGRLIGSTSVTLKDVNNLEPLAEAAMPLIKNIPQHADDAPRVAVLEIGPPDTRIFNFAVRLREALANADVTVPDRALTQGIVEEKAAAEKGWREELTSRKFLGAESFVELSVRDGLCELRVIRSRDGALLGARDISFEDSDSVDKLLAWLLPLLGRESYAETATYLPTVETEALVPFYRGLALYDAGQYAEAIAAFSRAYLINDKFGDALRWEAKCYDALDLPQLAAALRRFEETRLVGNGVSGSARTAPAEAVAFLGVSGGPSALSAFAASTLSRSDREIRLPDDLGRLSREYDWLAGLSETDGTRWEQAPSFFCRLSLSGTAEIRDGAWHVAWTLTDTALGKTIAREEQQLSKERKNWQQEMAAFLPGFLASETKSKPPSQAPQDKSVSALEKTLRQTRGLDANTALLKLLLAYPENPLLRVRGLVRGQSARDGLEAYLNFAKRDILILRIPQDSPVLPWLKLSRIYAFLESEPFGRVATDERPDVIAELEKFVEANPSSPAALVARYSILFEQQDEWPYAKLAETSEALLADLRTTSNPPPQADKIEQMTTLLRDFALVADGRRDVALPDITYKKLPRRVRIKWQNDGSPKLDIASVWSPNVHTQELLTPEQKIIEAQAILAINGVKGEHRKVQDSWLKEFPHSITLSAYAATALHELNYWYGKPLLHPLDWEAERTAFLETLNYIATTQEYWMERVETSEQLNDIEETVWAFFMALNERAYLGVLSDEKYLALRDRLAAKMLEADKRVGRNGEAWHKEQYLTWQKITPAQARDLRSDRLDSIDLHIYNLSVLTSEVDAAARRSMENDSADLNPIWSCLHAWRIEKSFSAPEVAAFYLRFTPEVLRRFRETPPNISELGYIFEQALALLNGGASVEAESLFRLILNLSPDQKVDTFRANAAFRLAQILRVNGQKPEAIAMARRSLEICGSTPRILIEKYYNAQMQRRIAMQGLVGALSAQLTRLLAEMRFDPTRAKLPPGTHAVSVPTPNMDNPQLNVFYRVPVTPEDTPRRVLVVIPSLNHEVLDLFQPGSPWVRFADEQGLVLLAPRFYVSNRADRAKHAFSYFIHAQVWSGKALLAALDKISIHTDILKDRLLFHGYGAGAGFAGHFARWRPDIVEAVSLHGGGIVLPWFQEYPGLLPLTALKDVRFLITAGENDDFALSTQNRFACAEALATVLQGAGVEVHWKPYPNVGHFSTSEMEAASREFLKAR